MNALILLENQNIGGAAVQTVNARDLHTFLGVNSKFADWMKNQIERARLVENRDYVTISKNLEIGRPLVEYHLTIEAGKSIGMMSATDKGFEIRDYFIECEKFAKQAALNPATMSRMQLLELAMQAEQERMKLEQKVELLEPKAQALDRLVTYADGSLCITNAAKDLQVRPKDLFGLLSGALRWIYRRAGGAGWVAYQDKLQQGLLEHKVTVVSRTDGSEKLTEQVLVTPKGLAKLASVVGGQQMLLQ